MPKRDLYFSKPLINAAGFLGFMPNGNNAPILEHLQAWGGLGAFVTDPISYLPRPLLAQPAWLATDGGMLMHNGLPSAGFWQTLKVAQRKWDASPLPIIPHLLCEDVERTLKMVCALERMESVMAVELGLPLYRQEMANAFLDAMPSLTVEMPLIVNLPIGLADWYGERFIRKGASAISLRPPRGRFVPLPGTAAASEESHSESETETEQQAAVSGRLYGGQVFAQAAEVVYRACKAGVPVIAAGGFDSPEKIAWAVAEGALAVQVDLPCWD